MFFNRTYTSRKGLSMCYWKRLAGVVGAMLIAGGTCLAQVDPEFHFDADTDPAYVNKLQARANAQWHEPNGAFTQNNFDSGIMTVSANAGISGNTAAIQYAVTLEEGIVLYQTPSMSISGLALQSMIRKNNPVGNATNAYFSIKNPVVGQEDLPQEYHGVIASNTNSVDCKLSGQLSGIWSHQGSGNVANRKINIVVQHNGAVIASLTSNGSSYSSFSISGGTVTNVPKNIANDSMSVNFSARNAVVGDKIHIYTLSTCGCFLYQGGAGGSDGQNFKVDLLVEPR